MPSWNVTVLRPHLRRVLCGFALIGLLAPGAIAEERASDASQSTDEISVGETDSARQVAARVGDDIIFVDEVERALQSALRGRKVTDELRNRLLASTMTRLVERRLIEHFLVNQGLGPASDEVDAEAARMIQQLEQRGQTLDGWLQSSGLTTEALRTRIRWRLAWQMGFPRYIEQQRTADRLEAYFDANREAFDGTEIRVRHILIRIDTPRDQAAIQRAIRRAEAIRTEIENGTIDFAAAARRFSAGPSREKGGDLGFFPRHGVMVEPFSTAAFALADGEVSQPVVTPFGVHLIQRVETRDGQTEFEELLEAMTPTQRKRMYDDVDRQIYSELVTQLQDAETVEFTGLVPGSWPPESPGEEETGDETTDE